MNWIKTDQKIAPCGCFIIEFFKKDGKTHTERLARCHDCLVLVEAEARLHAEEQVEKALKFESEVQAKLEELRKQK